MTIDIARHETTDDASGHYTITVDGEPAGELDFRVIDGRRVFTHTGIRGHFEGRGLAATLVRRALDDARADGVRIVPICSYVAHFLEQHPADQDLVDTELQGRLRG